MESGSDCIPHGISMGANHSLVIIEGSVYSWGRNIEGQLGCDTTNNTLQPQKIDNLINIVAVAWGYNHSMAINQNGDVFMWGQNTFGQLGDGTNENSKKPKKLSRLTNINMISCSKHHHSMALTKDGEVYTWGNNDKGQLGNGTTIRSAIPQKIANLSNIVAIASGKRHSMAITKEGDVYSWGGNSYGQLGNGTTIPSMIPLKITTLANVKMIACNYRHVLALTCNGEIYSWGFNSYGQLGNGTTKNCTIPQKIENLTDIEAIACGYWHSMALTKDGHVYSWGYNGNGQLGIGSPNQSNTPQRIDTLSDVYAIACMGDHSMALTKAGHLYAWGWNYDGQLGNGTNTNVRIPQLLSLPPGTLHWLRPKFTSTTISLHPKLLNQLKILSTDASNKSKHDNAACENQCHVLYANQTPFHLHKAILAVRAPELLNLKELNITPTLFKEIINFLYTNTPLNYENMQTTQIIQLLHVCKSVNLTNLIPLCQRAMVGSFTVDNIFDAAAECCLLKLTDGLDWICWFIGKNKLAPPTEVVTKLVSYPEFLSKLMQHQVADLTLPPPMFTEIQPRQLIEVMEVLYSEKTYSDFTINFKNKNTLIKVHKFVLAPRWAYFTNIMLRSEVHDTPPLPLDTFTKLIQFFYVGVKDLTLKDCCWILSVSDFYLLSDETDLLEYCDQQVNSQFCTNWPLALQIAMEIGSPELEMKAISMIPESENAKQVVSFCLYFTKEQQKVNQEQQRVNEVQQKENKELKKENQELKRSLDNILARLEKLESL